MINRILYSFIFFLAFLCIFAQSDQAILEKGISFLNAGDYDMSQKYLKPLVEKSIEGAFEPIWQSYVLRGKYEEAIAINKKMLEMDALSWRGKLLMGDLLLTLGQYTQAKLYLLEAYQIKPQNIASKALLGSYYYSIGDKTKYIQYFSQIFDDYDPDKSYTPEELYYIAKACYLYAMKTDEVERSDTLKNIVQEILPQAIKKDKYYFMAYRLMAEIFLDAFNPKDSKDIIEEALKINPQHPMMLYCQALFQLQNYELRPKAMSTLEQLLKINPHLVEALDIAAALSLADEEYHKANQYIEKALQVNPNSITTRSLLASLYYMEGRMQAYNAEEQKVLSINPVYGDFYQTVASMIGHKRQFSESVFLLRKAIELDPYLWHTYIDLGMNLMRVGEIEEAEKYFKKLQSEYNFHTQSHNMLILLKKYKEFKIFNTKNFLLRLHIEEYDIMKELLAELMEDAFATLSQQYKFVPKSPVIFEMFPTHDDFSVRTIGLDSLGASGACFGKLITVVSPKSKKLGFFNWASVAWHEFAHVVTLQMSDYQVPRWFTEGLSEFAEKQRNPSCSRNMDLQLYSIYTSGQMRNMVNLNAGFTRPDYPMEIAICYYQAGLICDLIQKEFGFDKIRQMLLLYKQGKKDKDVFQISLGMTLEEFDKKFLDWLDKNIFSKMNVFPTIGYKEFENLMDLAEEGENLNLEQWKKLALAFFQRKQFVDAQDYLNKILQQDASQAIAYDMLGQIHFAKQNANKAKESLEKAITLGSKNFDTALMLGILYQKDKDILNAIKLYEMAKKSYPGYTGPNNPYLNLAKIYKDTKQKEKAFVELEDYIKIEGTDFPTRLELAKEYFGLKKYQDSLKLLKEAQDIYPLENELQHLLGKAYRELQDWERSLKHYGILLALKPKENKHVLHAEIAELYTFLNNKEKSQFHAEESLRIKPGYKKAQEVLKKWEKP
ncbi:MAG: tetratricopeptide repeat protein [Candidatus Brocadiae bacterium]|nr:tetratricopeptide repeat protein [Candidatus Brocadiia bacterium]